ncbi:MAG TPA: FtsL-like putative cell division protein [Segetibacter sp.]|nr:FtsL-like putative cell division protein [Segetibacter sp.]
MSSENQIGKKSAAARAVGDFFNYSWIVKNIAFFLFLAVLAVVYIANGHMSDNRIRKINETARKLKDLQYEYKTLKSEMMFKSRESEMVKAAEPLGLTMDTISPARIKLISRKRELENN